MFIGYKKRHIIFREKYSLKWIVHGVDWSGSEGEKVADTCDCGDDSSGYIKRREFCD
jgi:hypothetical protein